MQSTTSTSLQQGGSSPTRSGSNKRPSTSVSPVPKKSLKKSPETIQGFSKLPLPITFPPLTSPTKTTLNRTMSEPISKLNPKNAPFSPFSATSSAHFSKPQFQETAKNGNFPSNALHNLLRSISDPTSLSFGVHTSETPTSQWVEKMKGSIKGISELCDEVICEEEKENEEYSEDVINEDHNKDCDDSVNVDNNGEEAVSVEKKGDSLVVHFNCPCGIDYEILLSGNNCYYRLT